MKFTATHFIILVGLLAGSSLAAYALGSEPLAYLFGSGGVIALVGAVVGVVRAGAPPSAPAALVLIIALACATACGPSTREVALRGAQTTLLVTWNAVNAYDQQRMNEIMAPVYAACPTRDDVSAACSSARAEALPLYQEHDNWVSHVMRTLADAWATYTQVEKRDDVDVWIVVEAVNVAVNAWKLTQEHFGVSP